MKTYPSIDAKIRSGKYYVFDKLDGSNVRCTWSKKRGIYKFGTRTRLLDSSEKILGRAVPLMQSLEKQIKKICSKERINRATLFFEFYGPNSFAGYHNEDDEFRIDLIDVSVYKKGIVPPKEFLKIFGSLPHAKLLYYGNITDKLKGEIKNGTLPGMTFEGVICKAKNKKKPGLPTMFKIKNEDWYKALKESCQDAEEYERLK